MYFRWLSNSYRAVDTEDTHLKPGENSQKRCFRVIMHGPAALLIVLVGFFADVQFSRHFPISTVSNSNEFSETAPHVPLDSVLRIFRYNESFAVPPPISGASEPIWDSLIPNGLGYVKYPSASLNISVISAFHQLHCLYTLRRIYRSTSNDLQEFDFGINRDEHAGHCFEYLRQSIQCAADSTMEPAGRAVDGFLGWGFKRECKSYGVLWSGQRSGGHLTDMVLSMMLGSSNATPINFPW